MKRKNAEAARLETDYCNCVRAALHQRDATEIEEILQSVREHIEEECAGDAAEEIGAVRMKNVLEQLGPPEAYGAGDGGRGAGAVATAEAMPELTSPAEPAVSKLAIASVMGLPAGVLMGILVGGLFHLIEGARVVSDRAILAGIGTAGCIFFVGMVLGILALGAIRQNPGRLTGRLNAWCGIAVLPVAALMLFLLLARDEGGTQAAPGPVKAIAPATAPVTAPLTTPPSPPVPPSAPSAPAVPAVPAN